ncbi:P-loop containing nucleoside triphosphate hydrolase protein [Schizopora paradoxa]|uniref:p-loop containing nucleoside triphosphate hydrolase protein n=1 Tax=Schizopora paradoxa TaxID=27342 RepID=A0A0H2RSH7_9AGAM|nr:P-loop containing nucleoside triphosphate hydrolase protein [Schizopora paradoxa]
MQGFDFNEDADYQPPASLPPSLPTTRPASSLQIHAPPHAIATPRPTLMFAIASDDPAAVEQVLASGEVRPNDDIGPQSALEFALTNDALSHRTEIVKTLLAYGADPSSLPSELRDVLNGREREEDPKDETRSNSERRRDSMNPAMKYYLKRARSPEAQRSTAAIRRSFFRPLTRIRFDFVGQDRALQQLYWVLNIHSQQPIASPLVVLCCGPSGHGKSLLARKFGSLLEVPTHTVNMTILKSAHDLWQCPTMSPYDEPSNRTLAEFLSENEGKRCIVVLDEIDKNEDEKNLWSLLAPWELGRCPIDGGRRHIDVRNVIWLGTSNIGQDQIFEYFDARDESASDASLSREDYRELMALLRPRVSAKLGTSLMSRVTAVLPFVPFSSEEKMAIASEALLSLGGDFAQEMSSDEFERFVARSVSDYVPTEGARSLYRSISNHLMEAF